MSITLAITTYNRSDLVLESFESVIDNNFINEIIILDDCSELTIYDDLKTKIDNLNNPKVKLLRNDYNKKPFINKSEAIKVSKNDWIVLLDSDNKINNEYIDVIKFIEKKEDTLYLPEKLIGFDQNTISDFSEMKNIVLNKSNMKNYLNVSSLTTFLNVGNFFVNKFSYLNTVENFTIEKDLETNDAIYFSFLWLMNNLNIKIVGNLSYFHRQHSGSWYLENKTECEKNTTEIINRIKNL